MKEHPKMLKIGLIIGSTRPNRFADNPARWIIEGARNCSDLALTVLDLRDQHLPLFDEPVPPARTSGAYSRQGAEAWRQRIGALDGFIATVAEYNHGPTAALKNAFDSAFHEWKRKPIAFVGYGGVGAARAIEQLRGVAIELQMAPIRHEVNITMEPFLGVVQHGKTLDDYPHLVRAREALFEDLVWWGKALKAAREVRENAAAA
jgi:NAD(P)H-dependent FMN reductase